MYGFLYVLVVQSKPTLLNQFVKNTFKIIFSDE